MMETLAENEGDASNTIINNNNNNNKNNINSDIINHAITKDDNLDTSIRRKFTRGSYLAKPSLPSTEEMPPSASLSLPSVTQTLLVPPASYRRERRSSTSSIDSSMSHHSSRSKRHKRSSSRLSDIDHEKHDVTLMTFATKTGDVIHTSYAFAQRILNKVLRKTTRCPILVCEAEVMEETSRICRDYIVHKMALRDLMSRKVTITAGDWPRSSHVIAAGMALEYSYPRTFSNVSRKLCMTMSSAKLVRSALTSLLEVLFEGHITWGKIVAMMSVSSLFAEECASQGHSDFVTDVVDTVMDLTSSKLLEWLVSQGGWESFPSGPKDKRNHVSLAVGRMVGLVILSATVFLSSTWLFDQWSPAHSD